MNARVYGCGCVLCLFYYYLRIVEREEGASASVHARSIVLMMLGAEHTAFFLYKAVAMADVNGFFGPPPSSQQAKGFGKRQQHKANRLSHQVHYAIFNKVQMPPSS